MLKPWRLRTPSGRDVGCGRHLDPRRPAGDGGQAETRHHAAAGSRADDKTKFIGPKGGKAKDGLKDDRMAKGNEVKVLPTKDGKTAKEVHLPYRKKSTDKDKK